MRDTREDSARVMPFYLAIDAGGTKTECCLADERRVLARARTGSVKLMRVGEAEATARLANLLAEVSALAGVPLLHVRRTCMGLSGLSIGEVRRWARETLGALVSGDLLLAGDEEIALDGAFRGGPGILVIAGTGSNILGRDRDGRFHNAGGWGPAVGDEGSGHWIGVEAIRRALHAFDCGRSHGMLEHVQRFLGLQSLPELVAWVNLRPSPDFAAIVPVVAACAETGDAVALGVLRRAGLDLARQVAVVHRKLALPDGGSVGLACTGSVLAHVPAVHASMSAALRRSAPSIHIVPEHVDAVLGALWQARAAG